MTHTDKIFGKEYESKLSRFGLLTLELEKLRKELEAILVCTPLAREVEKVLVKNEDSSVQSED